MGVLDDINAMKEAQKIQSGNKGNLSISQITNLLVNLPDAKKNLSYEIFYEIQLLYFELRSYKEKKEMGMAEYYETSVNIIKEFDKIAPYELYSGGDEREIMLLMQDIRTLEVEEQIESLYNDNNEISEEKTYVQENQSSAEIKQKDFFYQDYSNKFLNSNPNPNANSDEIFPFIETIPNFLRYILSIPAAIVVTIILYYVIMYSSTFFLNNRPILSMLFYLFVYEIALPIIFLMTFNRFIPNNKTKYVVGLTTVFVFFQALLLLLIITSSDLDLQTTEGKVIIIDLLARIAGFIIGAAFIKKNNEEDGYT